MKSRSSLSQRSHSWPPFPWQTRDPVEESNDHCETGLSLACAGSGPRVQPSSLGPALTRRSVQPWASRSRAEGTVVSSARTGKVADPSKSTRVFQELRMFETLQAECATSWDESQSR